MNRRAHNCSLYTAFALVAIVISCNAHQNGANANVDDDESSAAQDNAADTEDDAGRAIAAYTVREQELAREVRLSGTLQARETVRLAPRAAGSLVTLAVEAGERVEEGDLLAAVDLAEQHAELRRARAEVARLDDQRERLSELVARNAAPSSQLRDVELDIDVARADVELWRTRIRLGEVRAPITGTVVERRVDPGSSVEANQEILHLADLDDLVVRVSLSERDVVHLRERHPVDLRLDALPGHSFEAELRRILPGTSEQSRRVPVEFILRDLPPDLPIQPGFLVRGALDLDARDTIAIPSEALLASEREERFVFVVENDHLMRRDVETGVERRNWIEILDGLEAGEVIVGTNPSNLREGMRVRVTREVEDSGGAQTSNGETANNGGSRDRAARSESRPDDEDEVAH